MRGDFYGGITRLGRWRLFIVACFLTVPLAVVQVVPCSGAPKTLQQRRDCGWQVSSMGRCRNSWGDVTHGTLGKHGYCRINIKGYVFPLHRAVLLMFKGPPLNANAWQGNHLDGNKSNNQLENLDWTNQSENIQHSYSWVPRRNSAGSRSKPVMVNGIRYPSISEAARRLGQYRTTVHYRCRRHATVDGCEYRLCPCDDDRSLPGEKWTPMINLRSGKEVPRRMVSSHGRITSKYGIRSFGSQNQEGYWGTMISESSQVCVERIHRLVARAFLPWPPPTLEHTQVNHKDMNKSNNSVENLEWVTPAENNAHKIAHQKGPSSSWKPVLSRAYGSHDKWRHHPSVSKAAVTLNLDPSHVSKCARGRYRQTGGFEFRFVKTEEQDEDLPGEEWRDVDLELLLRDREPRKRKPRKIFN